MTEWTPEQTESLFKAAGMDFEPVTELIARAAGTGWTAEKLDALPAETLIRGVGIWYVQTVRGTWLDTAGQTWKSTTLAGVLNGLGTSVRVVAAPIDALLSDEAVRAAAGGHALGEPNSTARRILHAAIAHVTGEAL